MSRNINTEYVVKVKRWIELDNISEIKKTKLKEVVDEKKTLEDEIIDYIEANDMQNVQLNVSGGHIKFQENKGYQGFSQKNLKDNLTKYFERAHKEPVTAESIYDFLLKNRDVKTKLSIKRTITS